MTSGTSDSTDRKLDHWADWLIRGRDRGASEAQKKRVHRGLARVRDRVLRGARLRPGERVVDLGAGTGLLTLEARRRVKGSGFVVAIDVSADALFECRRQAERAENVAPVAYAVGDGLHIPLASESVDVVMTRSVLIYLADKQAGIRELYRVLKPKGRASIFEPINETRERVQNEVRARGSITPFNRSGVRFGRTTMRTRTAGGRRSWDGTSANWSDGSKRPASRASRCRANSWLACGRKSRRRMTSRPASVAGPTRTCRPTRKSPDRSLEIAQTVTLIGTRNFSSARRARDRRQPPFTWWPSGEVANGSTAGVGMND